MTEAELIKGCRKKNAVCQRLLFEAFASRLMTICLRYARNRPEAEDMLQESWMKIFETISQYRFEGSFEGWIKRITVNTCLRMLQKKVIRFYESEEVESTAPFFEPEVLSTLSEIELLSMIAKLPDGYRIVFNLYAIEGYNHDEIADMLHIESVTSRTQLAKARKMLQKQILMNQKNPVKHER